MALHNFAVNDGMLHRLALYCNNPYQLLLDTAKTREDDSDLNNDVDVDFPASLVEDHDLKTVEEIHAYESHNTPMVEEESAAQL